MAEKFRKFKAGEFGTHVNTESQPFPTIGNSTTTTVNLGDSFRKEYFNQGYVSAITLATSAGTVTVTIGKYDSTNSQAKVPLTAATDILVTTQVAKQTFVIPALSTLTPTQQTLVPADGLYADFIASGTVSAQAVGGIIGAETFILV